MAKPTKKEKDEGSCGKREDGTHCVHWWEGGVCCTCKHATALEDTTETETKRPRNRR